MTQIARYNATSVRRACLAFEQQYGMTTEAFYGRYTAGERVDAIDSFDQQVWASFHEDYRRLGGKAATTSDATKAGDWAYAGA